MSTSEPVPTVLIIEPDRATAQLYSRELSRRFRVVTCPSAIAGVALVASESPSAVVLEPFEAGASLEAVAAVLQEDVRQRNLPLIICSVLDDRSLGNTLGAVMQLVKPVLPATLLTALTTVFSTPGALSTGPSDSESYTQERKAKRTNG